MQKIEESLLKLAQLNSFKIKKKRISQSRYLNYLVTGEGPNSLIFLHGLNIGLGQWYKNLAFFSQKYTCYAIDIMGSGFSSKISYDNLDFYDDFTYPILELLEDLELDKFDIVAHSLSSLIAINAFKKNVKKIGKLVLVSPFGFSQKLPAKNKLVSINFFANLLTSLIQPPTRSNLHAFLQDAYAVNGNKIDPEFIDYYYHSVNQTPVTHPISLMNKLSSLLKIKSEYLLDKEYLSSHNNIYAILGELDKVLYYDDVYQTLPESNIYTMSGLGHVPMSEKPKIFNSTLDTIIES